MEALQVQLARAYKLAEGQVAEWLLWSTLVATSGGDLHVFLPLEDRGVDGIVHRISTDRYVAVQVKSGVPRERSGFELVVPENELLDDHAVIVAVELDPASVQVGAQALMVDVPTFRSLAQRHSYPRRGVVHTTYLSLRQPLSSKWVPWMLSVGTFGGDRPAGGHRRKTCGLPGPRWSLSGAPPIAVISTSSRRSRTWNPMSTSFHTGRPAIGQPGALSSH